MSRPFTVMLIIVGLVATALLRAHHCRGAVCADGPCSAVTTAITPGTSAPRLHIVLSDRAPGSVGACLNGCAIHETMAAAEREAPAPSVPQPHEHSHPHPHLACIDALPLTTAPVMDGAAALGFFAVCPAESTIDAPAAPPAARAAIERRGGDPPPGLRSTRLLI